MIGDKWLGKRVLAKTAYDHSIEGMGRVIAYCDAPSLTIERDDGTRFHWRADLCDIAPDEPIAPGEAERYQHTLRKIAKHSLDDPFAASAMQQWAAEALATQHVCRDATARGAEEE